MFPSHGLLSFLMFHLISQGHETDNDVITAVHGTRCRRVCPCSISPCLRCCRVFPQSCRDLYIIAAYIQCSVNGGRHLLNDLHTLCITS
ncbi:hypothetical protein LSH36_60g09027 [Paralvinella palmiformis]|uniref:Secreted protein n=1 Tax=Paralvinella palmiformis TaxID=53620 RepID=A0AAD9K4J7_9ANNE|nr:hypothetical protein LSH36_60g09027 [Paralvinella palmiformis]